ncbi:MAG: segregation/condensation protein A, partial [bacterium]
MTGTNGASPLHVHHAAFEGPLDLLYYLIRKHALMISEISLAVIADEFVAHVEAADLPDLSVAGGFLVIAST